MRLKKLIEVILSLSNERGMSSLEVNRVAYMACYHYQKSNEKPLIKNEWTMDKYGPYLQDIGCILNYHRKIKREKYVNHYGRELDKFMFTGKISKRLKCTELESIECAVNDFMHLNYIEFNNLLRNTEK